MNRYCAATHSRTPRAAARCAGGTRRPAGPPRGQDGERHQHGQQEPPQVQFGIPDADGARAAQRRPVQRAQLVGQREVQTEPALLAAGRVQPAGDAAEARVRLDDPLGAARHQATDDHGGPRPAPPDTESPRPRAARPGTRRPPAGPGSRTRRSRPARPDPARPPPCHRPAGSSPRRPGRRARTTCPAWPAGRSTAPPTSRRTGPRPAPAPTPGAAAATSTARPSGPGRRPPTGTPAAPPPSWSARPPARQAAGRREPAPGRTRRPARARSPG